MAVSFSTDTVCIPEIVGIPATEISSPPVWALMQRQLIETMEEAAVLTVKKYTDLGGVLYFADDVDDLYERFYNWGLFYAMGADDKLLNMALQEWNAITRSNDTTGQNPFFPWLMPQLHHEYYHLTIPSGAYASWVPGRRWISDWHHMGEGNMAFYHFGLANPTIAENVQRAKRFAAMHIGEDTEAPNYDPNLKMFRSPYTDAKGPLFEANVEQVKGFLHGGSPTDSGWEPKPMGSRTTLYPIIKELELNWWENPERREAVVDLFNKLVLQGDISANLGATGLITNAYLYTGEQKYKQWVLEYTEAWMDRMRQNKGIMPDHIGPTGKIGEHREGQWWGGWYGWNCYKGFNIGFTSLTIAAECALLLTGNFGYLDLLRSQIEVMMDNSVTREDGQLLVSCRYGPDGWHDYKPMPMKWLPHLYHASMSAEDYELMARVRDGERERDWTADIEMARFQYYDGKNPGWPEQIMRKEYEEALALLQAVRDDSRNAETIIADNRSIPNPVRTDGLTQLTMGAPHSVYNGGLLRATVRYFDPDRTRPGLPDDVAALVYKLESDRAGVQLVNLSRTETRNAIVQAGAFGEHQFSEVSFHGENQDGPKERTVPVNARYFAVKLPPSATIRLDIGMRRFANAPSYAFPWHGNSVPAPFQHHL